MEDVSTPALSQQAGYVTPNVNVIYGFGFVDLTQEPVILSVPDSKGLYYVVEIVDMYTNAFAYAAGKATGYGGGNFALVGPGWSGRLPDGVKRIDCPTPWVLLQPRVHLYDNGVENLARAKSMLDAITVTGLAKFSGETPVKPPAYNYAAPQLTDPKLPVSALDFQDPLQFWELFSAAMNENPPPRDQINALLPSFEPARDRARQAMGSVKGVRPRAGGHGESGQEHWPHARRIAVWPPMRLTRRPARSCGARRSAARLAAG
jgi:DNA sulfur modification protein DndE